jgi:hypothetical protein
MIVISVLSIKPSFGCDSDTSDLFCNVGESDIYLHMIVAKIMDLVCIYCTSRSPRHTHHTRTTDILTFLYLDS